MDDNDEPVMQENWEGNAKEWRRPSDNKLHRIGAPAVEWNDGSKVWYQNGKLHREDGPAYVDKDGGVEYHLFGESVTPQEFREKCRELAEQREERRQELMRQLMEACEDATVLKTNMNISRPLTFARKPVFA